MDECEVVNAESVSSVGKDIPARVKAAQAIVDKFGMRMFHWESDSIHQSHTPKRMELNKREQATYDAAMTCLQQYFLGEMDYGDIAATTVTEKQEEIILAQPVEEPVKCL
jgi:hypothetical protein